jgi:hypothetical protein
MALVVLLLLERNAQVVVWLPLVVVQALLVVGVGVVISPSTWQPTHGFPPARLQDPSGRLAQRKTGYLKDESMGIPPCTLP